MTRQKLTNPYLEQFLALKVVRGYRRNPRSERAWELKEQAGRLRHGMVELFAYALPTTRAIDLITRYAPDGILEIGAGLGYWTWLIRQRGLTVLAFDKEPDPAKNWYYSRTREQDPGLRC